MLQVLNILKLAVNIFISGAGVSAFIFNLFTSLTLAHLLQYEPCLWRFAPDVGGQGVMFDLAVRAARSFHLSRCYNLALVE